MTAIVGVFNTVTRNGHLFTDGAASLPNLKCPTGHKLAARSNYVVAITGSPVVLDVLKYSSKVPKSWSGGNPGQWVSTKLVPAVSEGLDAYSVDSSDWSAVVLLADGGLWYVNGDGAVLPGELDKKTGWQWVAEGSAAPFLAGFMRSLLWTIAEGGKFDVPTAAGVAIRDAGVYVPDCGFGVFSAHVPRTGKVTIHDSHR